MISNNAYRRINLVSVKFANAAGEDKFLTIDPQPYTVKFSSPLCKSDHGIIELKSLNHSGRIEQIFPRTILGYESSDWEGLLIYFSLFPTHFSQKNISEAYDDFTDVIQCAMEVHVHGFQTNSSAVVNGALLL